VNPTADIGIPGSEKAHCSILPAETGGGTARCARASALYGQTDIKGLNVPWQELGDDAGSQVLSGKKQGCVLDGPYSAEMIWFSEH
jgi:hypothetical protein